MFQHQDSVPTEDAWLRPCSQRHPQHCSSLVLMTNNENTSAVFPSIAAAIDIIYSLFHIISVTNQDKTFWAFLLIDSLTSRIALPALLRCNAVKPGTVRQMQFPEQNRQNTLKDLKSTPKVHKKYRKNLKKSGAGTISVIQCSATFFLQAHSGTKARQRHKQCEVEGPRRTSVIDRAPLRGSRDVE